MEDANVAATTLFGLALPYLVGKPMAALIEPRDVGAFRDATTRAAHGQRVSLRVLVRQRKGPASVAVHVRASRFPDRRILWALRDVDAAEAPAAEAPLTGG